MNFSCDRCQNSYAISDDKLPAGKKIAFPCPGCGTRIELDLRQGVAACPGPKQTGGKKPSREEDQAPEEERKQRIIRNLKELPPMPQIVFKAHEIMDDPNSNTKQVADLIETDQAIAAKVLRMANSAYYGMSGKVSSIQHASAVLGYKALGELITLAGTSSLLGSRLYGYDMDSGALWRHSIAVAFASKSIARRKKPSLENDAFSAGLIHDVGKLILDRPVLNRKKLFDEYMGTGDRTFLSAEKKILGFDHAEIGHEVCKHWKIPESLALAIRHHHQPDSASGESLAAVVCMADTVANMAEAMQLVGKIENDIDAVMYMLDDEVMVTLSLEEKDVREIMTETTEAVVKITSAMSPA
jgi:putative nucleotidyltransferase with HDIG domain/predicted Zn finger-like uncharacterized protein